MLGSSYTLVLTRKAKTNNRSKKEFDLLTDKIKNLVESVVPNSSLVSNISSEIKFQLPSQMTLNFTELFEKLDKLKDQLSIINIGINFTTLEQVFLK